VAAVVIVIGLLAYFVFLPGFLAPGDDPTASPSPGAPTPGVADGLGNGDPEPGSDENESTVIVPSPQVEVIEAFLESDISHVSNHRMDLYPQAGSFSMGDSVFFRGFVAHDRDHNSTITYNIAGRGFTRLTGTLGRTGNYGGTMTITGDGTLIAGFEISATSAPYEIDVDIPPGTEQVFIRLQGRWLGLADATFLSGTSAQPLTHPRALPGEAYLQSDIVRTSSHRMDLYPQAGSFRMGDTVFFRGFVSHDRDHNSTITYNIAGRGYTRLTGTFGRTGSYGGTMTITGDGTLIAGFEIGATSAPYEIDVDIPQGTEQVIIRLQGRWLGLADAAFSSGAAVRPFTHQRAFPGEAYLQSDIIHASSHRMSGYPHDGSFKMGDTVFFRGFVAQDHNASITYDVAGRGFTRLTGTFGRQAGNGGTISITGDGVLLAEFEISDIAQPFEIDVDIPPGTEQVIIALQGRWLGLGDAIFR